MKLEVGMYVRSKINGMIGKITDIEEIKVFDRYLTVIREETRYILDDNHNRGFCETENDSVKASNNIIDLIEVGDYVNGYKVIEIGDLSCYDNRIGSKYIEIDFNVENDNEHWCEDTTLQNPDIKSIVTKEQFESMSYKVDK